ncbi:aminoglycoside phosphotransferase family protein [Stackebrandtia soli]|uniref:aminoglycoside phosphotransferase family protein n=1 Tax=Stackebrandtia soli TaxID=1892856 RepID=UPI0039ED8214
MPLLPPFVITTIDTYFGDRGREWIDALPATIAARCEAWGLTVTGSALDGGTHSYVAPVSQADGSPAVLKLPIVDEENLAEATALRLYDGDGAVRLYDFDPVSGAILMEAAIPGGPLVVQGDGPHREGRPEHADEVRLGCELYRRLWRVSSDVVDGYPAFPLVTDLVAQWGDDIPKLAAAAPAGAIPSRLLDLGEGACARMSTPDGQIGVVNRDTHLGNIVAAGREPWLLIDPKPLLGERAFDAGYLTAIQVETDPTVRQARLAIERTARWLDVDPDRVADWAFLRALENTVWAFGADTTDDADLQLAVAVALADR